jgi:hypothetical protein
MSNDVTEENLEAGGISDLDRWRAVPLVVTEDNRLGNCPRLILHPEDTPLMHLPPLISEIVVFLAYKAGEEFKDAGTGFLLSMPVPEVEGSDYRQCYLITARHVIEAIEKKSTDGLVQIRVNTRDRGADYVSIEAHRFTKHPTRNVDAAVLPVSFGYKFYKQSWNPIENKLTPALIEAEQIGPGDDVFFPGLFVHHKGESENIPIVRTGTIAAMPTEPIRTSTQGLMKAYLIEARSIGGLSGSPVFLHLEGPRALRARDLMNRFNKTRDFGAAWNSFFIIGMVQGHYSTRDILDSPGDDSFDMRSRSINDGIAIVVPFEDIEEILNTPALAQRRATRARKHLEKQTPPTVDD